MECIVSNVETENLNSVTYAAADYDPNEDATNSKSFEYEPNGSYMCDGEEDLSNGADSEDSGEQPNEDFISSEAFNNVNDFLSGAFVTGPDGIVEPRKLCLVCSDFASGLHYGIASCEACKAFFKRTVQGNIEYSCPASGTCEITKRRRKACQACRYQKCLSVGMLKEGVRVDRVRGGRQKYKRSSTDPSSMLIVSQSLLAKRPSLATDYKIMIAALMAIEPEKVFAMPDSNLPNDEFKLMLTLSDLADRELVATIGWAKQVPGFSTLPLPDQMNLLQSTWLEILLFNIAFRSIPYTGVMVYSDDFKCTEEETSKFGMPSELDLISRKLSKKMSLLAVTNDEYFFLKAILLFNPDINVKNPDLVQQHRERMQDCLLEYEFARGQQGNRRLCSLLFLFPLLMHEKIMARDFWLTVKKNKHIKLHKLLSEMLDFMYT